MIGCQALCNYTLLGWGPAFFERVHGWPRSQIGLTLGLITIGSGCFGLICGGRLADRWHRHGVTDGTLRVGLISLIGVGIYAADGDAVAAGELDGDDARLRRVLHRAADRLPYAALQYIFPNQMRGVASAVVLFIVNFTGLGLGWLLPGLLNDRLFQDPLKVGHSIALTVVIAEHRSARPSCS